YDYMNMSIYAQGYAENEGHMWNQGNLEYWLLTGDEQVRRSALQLGDWLAGPDTIDFGYGNARVPGWMGIIAMSSYSATDDPYYLNAMHLIYEEVQEMADPDAGLWVHKLGGGHCRCEEPHYGEAGFMSGVLMTALKYYYLATGEDEVAERIVKIANWLVENLYDQDEDNFRYTACPHTSVSTTSPMIMAKGMAFAANYSGDEELMELVRRTFVRGFVAFAGSGGGKSFASATCAAPMAIHEISKFPGPTLDELHEELVQAALDPARRPLPSLVPNPNFEQNLNGWTVRSGLTLSHSTDVAHTGRASAMAEGTMERQNEYFVTRYSCGPPWEIMWLEPGEAYRLQLWLRVDELNEGAPAPSTRLAVRSKGITRDAFTTNEYDLTRLGEWQLLETEFTVPEGTDAAYIAVNTNTHDPVTTRMYLDDVAIVPADEPRRETYAWTVAEATEADLAGGVEVVAEGILDGWDVLSSPAGDAGSASFTLELPLEDEYEILVRAKATGDAGADLRASVDGDAIGAAAVTEDGWSWITIAEDKHLGAGGHSITLDFPAGAEVMVHSVLLTNR
ncbi:MAG: carbohydrate binding domain-containing protein, partial [Armatimonadota bacterium]